MLEAARFHTGTSNDVNYNWRVVLMDKDANDIPFEITRSGPACVRVIAGGGGGNDDGMISPTPTPDK